MSEYQFVAFRAIDGPVNEKNLDYMERQSSHAEISQWSFESEYHHGDFHGNASEMLRRGYDIHLQYANFGIRKLMIRLPHGLPDARATKPYFVSKSLCFLKDKQGSGGSLSIQPFYEPDDLEELWELDELIDRLVPLKAEILSGDLRPLYLAHLAVGCDCDHAPEDTKEAPIPAGLGTLSNAQRALAEFYGLSDSFLTAAAQESPPSSASVDPTVQQVEWLKEQPEEKKTAWLAELIASSNTAIRSEILAEFRKSHGAALWPTVRRDRSIAELRIAAAEIAKETERNAAENAARQRAKRLAKMAADPAQFLEETERLVPERSTKSYRRIGELLVDLRDALAGSERSDLAEQQAQKLKKQNPTLKMLTSELRRRGFLPK